MLKALLETGGQIEEAARLVASVKPNVITFGCTSCSFVGGIGQDQKVIKKIENATGIQASTTTTAVVNALKHPDVKRISIATPYPEGGEVNLEGKRFFEASGFKVLNIKGMYSKMEYDILKEGRIPFETIYIFSKSVCKPEADAFFISCINFAALGCIEPLEHDLRKPVVTANQATMWDALRKSKVKEIKGDFGELMKRL